MWLQDLCDRCPASTSGLSERSRDREGAISQSSELDARGSERSRRAALTSISILVAHAASVASGFVSVPLALGYLGVERYGLLVVVVSVSALLSLGDLGIGNALVNAVADAQARGSRGETIAVISAATLIVGAAISTLVAIAVVFVYPRVSWDAALNVQGSAGAGEAGPAVLAAVLLAAATVVFNLAQQVRRAHQEGYWNSAFTAAGSVLSLVVVAAVTQTGFGLMGVVMAVLGVPMLAAAANAAVLLGRDRPWLRPSISTATLSAARELITPGLGFFLYQAALVFAWPTLDTLIASRVSDTRAAAEYAIAAKLFLLPTTMVLAVLMPLWPAYRDALARGETDWVRHTLTKSLWRTFGFMLPSSLLIIAAADFIVELWIGTAVEPSTSLLAGSGAWAVFAAICAALSVYLAASGRIRFLVITTLLTAAAHLALSTTLGTESGAAGVAWGTAIATLVFMLVPDAVYVRNLMRSPSPIS